MLPVTIRNAPRVADYTPLAEYQSTTPDSFIGGKAILHLHLEGATATVAKDQSQKLVVFASGGDAASIANEPNGDTEQNVEQQVDIFVNSESFTIYSERTGAGISIPYPSISIHAVKSVTSPTQEGSAQAVWVQLEFSVGGADDDEFNPIELTIIPAKSESSPSSASQLYEAIANCSNLNPDPADGEDDEEDEYDRIVFEGSAEHEPIEGFTGVLRGATDGGLPPPMPGSGGWITAENMHEYFDEDGNWIGDGGEEEEELGEGAGRTRDRDELEGPETNGHESTDDPENKRPRVD